MKQKAINFPSDSHPLDMQAEIKTPKSLGLTVKVAVHEIARKLPLYDQPIKCDAKGQSSDGKKIKVNNVGRWLFGVPGYEGHLRIASNSDKILLYYSKNSPKVVHELIASLKEAVETK